MRAMKLAVLAVGPIIKGAQRWLIFGPVRLQPSELFKIIMVVIFARLLARRQSTASLGLPDLILPAAIAGLPAFLILRQPDLGTAMLVVLTSATFLLIVPVRIRTVVGLGVTGIASVSFAWIFYLHDYQKKRISTFINPDLDPLGTAYHAIQSQIAVGSGELLGKGYMQGTQSQLRFLPARHTDFILAVLAEEWGFLGVATVIGLYILYIASAAGIAMRARDRAGILLVIGLLSVFCFHVLYNSAMVVGFLPNTGIPLPFLSYGGSFTLFNFAATGIILGVDLRRYVNR